MRRRLTLALVVLAACDYPRLPRLATDVPGAGGADAAVDSAPPGSDGCMSFATLLPLDTCQLAFDADLVIPSGTAIYDTGMHVLTVGGVTMPVARTMVTLAGDAVEVISARNVTLGANASLRGVGPLPLAIVASGKIVIGDRAQIAFSSGGAGAQTSCDSGPAPGAADSGGGAGGGGGGYGAAGGAGGNGDSDSGPSTGPSTGGARGLAVASFPTGLRGGCPGASGGAGVGAGGAGGSAGGGLYLVAAGRIEMGSATVHSGGGAGHGGSLDAGGGGGGSGGMLLLEAPQVIGPDARIAANGGGGGGGGSAGEVAGAGEDGAAGTFTDARAGAGRGTSSIFAQGAGADGGRGGCRSSPVGEDVIAIKAGGGGGGGGGVGIIRIKAADLQVGTISPAPR